MPFGEFSQRFKEANSMSKKQKQLDESEEGDVSFYATFMRLDLWLHLGLSATIAGKISGAL